MRSVGAGRIFLIIDIYDIKRGVMLEQTKTSHTIIKFLLFVALCCGVAFILIFAFRGKEINLSEDGAEKRIDSLSCNSTAPTSSFFNPNNNVDLLHNVKITFRNGKVDKFFYNLSGDYPSDNLAGGDAARFGVQYDLYMADNGISSKTLYTTFSNVGKELYVVLYAEADKINPVTAPIFFLTKEFREEANYSIEDYREMYEAQNFSCVVNNNQAEKEDNE